MRTALGLLAVTALTPLALADTPQRAPQPSDAAVLSDHEKLLDPIQVDSLTVTPIVATQPEKDKTEMIVLDEAMPKKLVHIKEVDTGDVNNLTLTNSADRPLFLLAGEVIIGGKQDRIIGRNTVIPAKTTQQVPVFCVEHGRWTEQTKEFTTAKALAHGRLRGEASFSTQEDVWNEVAKKNSSRKIENKTGTYRQVAEQQATANGSLGDMEKKVDGALDKLTDDQKSHLVGFAVAINGKVATVDLFNSHALFAKLENKLVRSYLTEAVDIKAEKDVRPPPPAAVKDFMSDSDKAAEEDSYDTHAAKTKISKGRHSAKAAVQLDEAPAASPPVYKGYSAH